MAASPAPFDLTALRRACAPVITWYERFLTGQGADVRQLDDALVALRGLPPMGGRLGRAVATIVSGGAQASTPEVLVAFEDLRATAALRTPMGETPRPPRRAREDRRGAGQLRLPGFG